MNADQQPGTADTQQEDEKVIIIPKGLLPQQDTGMILGISAAAPDVIVLDLH